MGFGQTHQAISLVTPQMNLLGLMRLLIVYQRLLAAKVGIADFTVIDVVKIFLGITVDNDLRV